MTVLMVVILSGNVVVFIDRYSLFAECLAYQRLSSRLAHDERPCGMFQKRPSCTTNQLQLQLASRNLRALVAATLSGIGFDYAPIFSDQIFRILLTLYTLNSIQFET